MKNIHILPTNRPSYLYKKSDGTLHISDLFEGGNSAWKNQNIYITNDEEIKEGDWVYCTERKLFGKVVEIQLAKQILDTSMLYFEINDEEIWCKLFNCKKIILTTDVDLIKDGVQAIGNEFLEWFVKNPSCEEVEVVSISRCCGRCYVYDDLCVADKCCDDHHEYGCEICYGKRINYKIIIPKEELGEIPKGTINMVIGKPKQELPGVGEQTFKIILEENWLKKKEILEEVKIEFDYNSYKLGKVKYKCYKIIIPKEEPKKKHIVMLVGDKVNEEPKQDKVMERFISNAKQKETIEETAKTVEEYFLENIKNVLLFKNDAQAIRFMEKYYEAKKQEDATKY